MFEALSWQRFRVALILILVTAVGVWIFEFRILQRPVLTVNGRAAGISGSTAASLAAPVFGLSNVSFACAAAGGFVTEVRVQDATVVASCSTGFTEATTRCPSSFPMRGYGEQIKCAEGESKKCSGAPVQAVGLFKDDSYCGETSDRDMGPPGDSSRAE